MQNEFVEYVIDNLSSLGEIKAKAMFGGFGLYIQKQIFAIIVDNELYLKTDPSLATEFRLAGSNPFTYNRGNKKISMSYYLVPAHILEDIDKLNVWAIKSIKVAMAIKNLES